MPAGVQSDELTQALLLNPLTPTTMVPRAIIYLQAHPFPTGYVMQIPRNIDEYERHMRSIGIDPAVFAHLRHELQEFFANAHADPDKFAVSARSLVDILPHLPLFECQTQYDPAITLAYRDDSKCDATLADRLIQPLQQLCDHAIIDRTFNGKGDGTFLDASKKIFRFFADARDSYLRPVELGILRVPYMLYARFPSAPLTAPLFSVPFQLYSRGSFQLWSTEAKSQSVIRFPPSPTENAELLFQRTQAGDGPPLTMSLLQKLRFVYVPPGSARLKTTPITVTHDTDPGDQAFGSPSHVTWMGDDSFVDDTQRKRPPSTTAADTSTYKRMADHPSPELIQDELARLQQEVLHLRQAMSVQAAKNLFGTTANPVDLSDSVPDLLPLLPATPNLTGHPPVLVHPATLATPGAPFQQSPVPTGLSGPYDLPTTGYPPNPTNPVFQSTPQTTTLPGPVPAAAPTPGIPPPPPRPQPQAAFPSFPPGGGPAPPQYAPPPTGA